MTTKRIEPYRVVSIETGEQWLPAYMEESSFGVTAYRPEGLKKDGTPSGNAPHSSSHLLVDGHSVWRHSHARYVPEREAKADPIRARIKLLREQIADAEGELLNAYKEEGA